ncbi:hypothetical protein CYMTET_29785, partial [Cymbomonas tetramitiformis]
RQHSFAPEFCPSVLLSLVAKPLAARAKRDRLHQQYGLLRSLWPSKARRHLLKVLVLKLFRVCFWPIVEPSYDIRARSVHSHPELGNPVVLRTFRIGTVSFTAPNPNDVGITLICSTCRVNQIPPTLTGRIHLAATGTSRPSLATPSCPCVSLLAESVSQCDLAMEGK